MGLDGHFYVNVTQEAATGDGVVYRLAHVDHPTAHDLVEFHRWSGGTGNPDDMAIGASGRLYVSLPFQNVIAVLAPGGTEITRFPTGAQAASLPVPLDTPSGIAFDDATRSIYITNHAEFSGITANMVVYKSYVNDLGWPLARPFLL